MNLQTFYLLHLQTNTLTIIPKLPKELEYYVSMIIILSQNFVKEQLQKLNWTLKENNKHYIIPLSTLFLFRSIFCFYDSKYLTQV